MSKPKQYAVKAGMVLEKKYRRKIYKLLIVEKDGNLQFEIDKKLFPSMTAAAKYVVGEHCEISGPHFWRAPLSKS